MVGALCYVYVPNIDKLTILTFQLELGEFAPGLEPLEFVSGECRSNLYGADTWTLGADTKYITCPTLASRKVCELEVMHNWIAQ